MTQVDTYFNSLWKDFEIEAKKGNYKKVPYEDYRRFIKPLLDNDSTVTITPLTSSLGGYKDCAIENELGTTYWSRFDKSLGQYIFDTWFASSSDFDNKLSIAADKLYNDTKYYKVPYQDDLSFNVSSIPISDQINDICKNYIENNYNTINKKEKNSMGNKIVNFDFGPCNNSNIRMSMYGLAVMSPNGNWVSFDSSTNSVVDVDIINFESKNLFYKVPVAIKDIKVGDTIVHNRKAMFVKEVAEGATSIVAVDAANAEVKTILPVKSMFGFDFYTKIVSIMDFCGGVNASVDTPFGNVLPMIMLAGDTNIDDILPMLMLTGGNKDFMSNPMMLYFLAKDGNMSKDNLLPLMFLMNKGTN